MSLRTRGQQASVGKVEWVGKRHQECSVTNGCRKSKRKCLQEGNQTGNTGFETVGLTERQEAAEMAELKMLRFSVGVTKMDSALEGQHRSDVLETKLDRPY